MNDNIQQYPTAEQIYHDMLAEAQALKAPERRLANIRRLVEACNAIEDGSAVTLVKSKIRGAHKAHFPITPTNIQKYVKARQKLDPSWTGPKRETIENNELFKLYVLTREQCRPKNDLSLSTKRSKTYKAIDEALNTIEDNAIRQEIRFKIADGRVARMELNTLKAGLKKLPAIDINQITGQEDSPNKIAAHQNVENKHFSSEDKDAIQRLLNRITDPSVLRNLNLVNENGRVKHDKTGRPLIKPDEIEALRNAIKG